MAPQRARTTKFSARKLRILFLGRFFCMCPMVGLSGALTFFGFFFEPVFVIFFMNLNEGPHEGRLIFIVTLITFFGWLW